LTTPGLIQQSKGKLMNEQHDIICVIYSGWNMIQLGKYSLGML
jgi:hypothetical protein